MGTTSDKLSNIAALRPPAGAGTAARPRSTQQSERLAELLGAESRSNRLGRHLAVHRVFPELCACTVPPRALELLAPGAPEEALLPDQWIFLDTETTGLAGGTGTYAFLVGIAWWAEGGFHVEQLFMRHHGEEASLLLELSSLMAGRRVLVTFNGKSFDWPLLETRYRMTRTAASAPTPDAHLDLFHPARQIWRLRLESVALAQLERHVLGAGRRNDIPSRTIPQRYFDFLRGGPAEPIAEIFRHNQLDLCGLASLAGRILGLLENPEESGSGPDELFGVSRILARRGERESAVRLCQEALDRGLGEPARRMARRELALAARRRRDYERANGLWEQLAGDGAAGLEAYEQLAIHYEHREGDPERAISLTRRAMVKLREDLLARKIPAHQYRRRHAGLEHRLERLLRRVRGPGSPES